MNDDDKSGSEDSSNTKQIDLTRGAKYYPPDEFDSQVGDKAHRDTIRGIEAKVTNAVHNIVSIADEEVNADELGSS